MISARPVYRRQRAGRRAMPLAVQIRSGFALPSCSQANIAPVRAKPGLHLVGDSGTPHCFLTAHQQRGQEAVGRTMM